MYNRTGKFKKTAIYREKRNLAEESQRGRERKTTPNPPDQSNDPITATITAEELSNEQEQNGRYVVVSEEDDVYNIYTVPSAGENGRGEETGTLQETGGRTWITTLSR